MSRYLVFVVVALQLGCVNAVRVSETGSRSRLPGVPFYAKTDLFRQSSVYEVRWADVTLEVSVPKDDKVQPVGSLHTLAKLDDPKLDRLRQLIIEANLEGGNSPEKYEAVMVAFLALKNVNPAVDPSRPPGLADLVSNTLDKVVDVDYSRTYYLNGPLPWFGSSKVTAELAADGTLTKASTETESKAAEALSTLLPLKEFLSARFVAPLSAQSEALSEGEEASVIYLLNLRIEPSGYRYTIVADYPDNPCGTGNCALAPLAYSSGGRWSRAFLSDPPAPKKDDANAIAFSGEVKLPKK